MGIMANPTPSSHILQRPPDGECDRLSAILASVSYGLRVQKLMPVLLGGFQKLGHTCGCDLGALLNHLAHHTDGNFGNADGLDVHAYRTRHSLQLFGCGDFLINKLREDQPFFAAAADHAEKSKGFMDPTF